MYRIPITIGALIILLFQPSYLFSQYDYIPVDKLIEAYPDNDVILYDSKVDYTIKVKRKNKSLLITEETYDKFVALKDDAAAFDRRYYSNYIELSDHDVIGTGNFNPLYSKMCGRIEMDGVFYHDVRSCDCILDFDEKGEFLNVVTSREYLDQKYFTRFFFTNPYGVFKKSVRIEVPEAVDIELIEMNFEGFDITKTEYTDSKDDIRHIEYLANDIPAYTMLDNLPEYSCTFPYVIVHFRSFVNKGEKVRVLENTDDLYSWYKTLQTDVSISPDLQGFTNQLCEGLSSDTARISKVFYYVQDKIRYLAYQQGYAAYVPDLPDNVYQKKYGDCKGMANLCKAMLIHLGFDARLCWIYSGHSCQPENIPSIGSANHVICALKLNDAFVFLDPTSKYTSLFEINSGIQGKECIIEDGENYIIGHVPAFDYRRNLRQTYNNTEIVDDRMHIKGEVSLHGIYKSFFQNFATSLPENDFETFIKFFITTGDNNYSINDYASTGIEYKVDQFIITYDMFLENNVIDLGDELLLLPNLSTEYYDHTIDTSRQYPYSFDAARLDQNIHTIHIPEGYTVSSVPDSLTVEHSKYEFHLGYEVNDSCIYYRKNIAIKDIILEVHELQEWNQVNAELSEFYKQIIVFKKKEYED